MAGYICKIVIENTHPPVWRRVIVPERITFEELHEMIQILFSWGNEHLHEFEVPGDRIYISDQGDTWANFYNESETLIDAFFTNYKWLRYTYDSGDNWRHRINIEKTDEEYQERRATLLKFKGDNFTEDNVRDTFDSAKVEQKLNGMNLSLHEELQQVKLLKESLRDLTENLKRLFELDSDVLQSQVAAMRNDLNGDCNPMKLKIEAWRKANEKGTERLLIKTPEKSQSMLLMSLGEKEAADYYKYLRIPRTEIMTREEQVQEISKVLLKHPKYLYYIFDEKEYAELKMWMKLPQGMVTKKIQNINMFVKALAMGLADFTVAENCGEIRFATDSKHFIETVDDKTRKNVYNLLHKFDDRMGKLIQVYGVIELDSLYQMHKKLYDAHMEKDDFLRIIYWHCRFNDFMDTVYQVDGTAYAASKELDARKAILKIQDYAKELPYAEYSRKEIEHKAYDLANRSDWLDVLFTTFYYRMKMYPYEAQDLLIQVVGAIMSGDTLNEIILNLQKECDQSWDIGLSAEIWTVIAGIMLDLELPMLKGRTRIQYAEEMKCSPWTVGMVIESEQIANCKEKHMYQFSNDVQERMYEAGEYGDEHAIKYLLDYKEQNQVCSEEYVYLLASACITFGKTDIAEKLIGQLKRSSPIGKKEARELEKRLQQRYEVVDDDGFNDFGWIPPTYEQVQQPYVRTSAKIGRNDPCPCGSGKKYKKCCGRN